MSKVRTCAQVLPHGKLCTQFALRNQAYCRNHADKNRRDRTLASRQIVALMPHTDLFEVALTLYNTIFELRGKHTPPLHAYSIFDAGIHRLDQLLTQMAPPHLDPGQSAAKPIPNNGLQAEPIK